MKPILALILIFILFASCCKEYPIPNFTEEELSWMPYKEGDTLKMIGNNGKKLFLTFINKRTFEGSENTTKRAFLQGCPNNAYKGIEINAFNVGYKTSILQEYLSDTLNHIETQFFENFLIHYRKNSNDSTLFYMRYGGTYAFNSSRILDTLYKSKNIKYRKFSISKAFFLNSSQDTTVNINIDIYHAMDLGIFKIKLSNLKNYDYEIF